MKNSKYIELALKLLGFLKEKVVSPYQGFRKHWRLSKVVNNKKNKYFLSNTNETPDLGEANKII